MSCWADYCLWHISLCNREDIIVLDGTSKYTLSTEPDIWLQPQTLDSFAASLLLHDTICNTHGMVSFSDLPAICPQVYTIEKAVALHCIPARKKHPNYMKVWGGSQLVNLPLDVCDVTCANAPPWKRCRVNQLHWRWNTATNGIFRLALIFLIYW